MMVLISVVGIMYIQMDRVIQVEGIILIRVVRLKNLMNGLYSVVRV